MEDYEKIIEEFNSYIDNNCFSDAEKILNRWYDVNGKSKDFYYYLNIALMYGDWIYNYVSNKDIDYGTLVRNFGESISEAKKRISKDLPDEDVEIWQERLKELGEVHKAIIKALRDTTTHHDISSMESVNGKGQESSNRNGSTKSNIEDRYHELISILEKTRDKIGSYSSKHKNISKLQKEMFTAVDNEIVSIEKEIDNALNCISWENLVIAFFGETNAGKSTIIETFRILFEQNRTGGQDGLIVGDGRQDFTKDYHEYSMSISGKTFTLIDVPGIEGNEDEFLDVIKEALHKAHCVFYVQGHNKKPDSATAQKIKKYLGDWVNVYSIYNVRGSVTDYDEEDERETLLTDSVLKNEKLIKETFRDILGNVYKGHITLQALLAMCAKASFSHKRDDLQRNQNKLLGFFGNAEEVLCFSQFSSIRQLVEEKASNFTDEITEANKQKMTSLALRSVKRLEDVISSDDIDISVIEQKLKQFKRDIQQITGNCVTNIKHKVPNCIYHNFSILKGDLNSYVDKGVDVLKNKGHLRIARSRADTNQSIKEIIHAELINAQKKIENKKKELSSIRFSSNFAFDIDVEMNVNLDDALDDLDLNLDKIGDLCLSAASGAGIGSFFGPIGAGIGAVIGAGAHLLFSDGGKSEAKKNIAESIEEAEKKATAQVNGCLISINQIIYDEQRRLMKEVEKEINNLNALSDSSLVLKKDIKNYINIIKRNAYGTV
ncbi:MAG: 50S ribosome-binding GTPase [Muribaculaceae bacterium]|nr:50S ribosome-binding GTPase [Muribaculaceae bacterium]